MAATAHDDDDDDAGGSPITAVIFLVVAALTAAGAGFGAGKVLFAPMVPEAAIASTGQGQATDDHGDDHAAMDAKDGAKGKGGHGTGDLQVPFDDLGKLKIVDLSPVTTNLAPPSQTWVRAEFSLGIDGEADEAVIAQIESDIVAYLRTVRQQSVSHPSGFQHLLADIQDRAALRSEGAVKRVFVKALLFE